MKRYRPTAGECDACGHPLEQGYVKLEIEEQVVETQDQFPPRCSNPACVTRAAPLARNGSV